MILVAGSTGSLGTEIVRRLLSKGEAVRALARVTSAPEKVDSLKSRGAEVARGNLLDRESLDNACIGVKTVISTVSTIGTAQPEDSFADTDAAGTIALIEAAKAAGAKHFIFVSFDADHFPDTPLTDAKRAVEKHLLAGGIDYTILQPPPFMEVWLGPHLFGDPAAGPVKIYGEGEGKVPYVARTDVAEVAVRSVNLPSARNQTIRFGGPESISQREAVKIFEEAIGKPLDVVAVPAEALEAQWKTSQNPFEKTFAGLMLGVARLNEAAEPLKDEMKFKLATVRDYVKKTSATE